MFEEIATLARDTDQMFQRAGQQLVESGQLHRLFDLRLLECRHRLALPLEQNSSLDELADPERSQLEDAYLAACREVGQLLLKSGQSREAWGYLKPASEKKMVRDWLATVVPDDANADELIELALYEAVDPERGFAWLLARRGTCNAITEFGGLSGQLPVADQVACAALLVRHLHEELLGNIGGHLERLEEKVPSTSTIRSILDLHPSLLQDGAYHVDTSHLATTVRYARLLTDAAPLRLAIDLADYGRRLEKELQYPGEPPFEDLYPTHLQFFQAVLGEQLDQGVDYFAEQARTVAIDMYGTAAIETYLVLLVRTGQSERALAEYSEVVPAECVLSPLAPSLLQLAQAGGQWERYFEICRQRGDLVGFAAGQLLQ